MHQAEDRPFRVIIVGAGVSGLVLAHALQLAKIDFILLEKGIVAPPWGTSITSTSLSPQALVLSDTCCKVIPAGARLLHHIGILGAVEKRCTPMKYFCCKHPSTGATVLKERWFDVLSEKHEPPDDRDFPTRLMDE